MFIIVNGTCVFLNEITCWLQLPQYSILDSSLNVIKNFLKIVTKMSLKIP